MTPTWESDCGKVRLWLGDCLDVLPCLEAGSVGCVITSPPYNLGTTTGGGCTANSKMSKLGNGYGSHDDAMPHSEYVAWQHHVLRECWRTLQDDGAIFYNHKPRVQDHILRLPLELNPGLPLRQIVIWDRGGGINMARGFYTPSHEWVCVFAHYGWGLTTKALSATGDVWRIMPEIGSEHPAPFPIGLPLRVLDTIEAETILDPFMGSGTTGIACIRTGRRFLGIEKDAKYFEIAKRRIQEELASTPLFESLPETQPELFGELAEVTR